MNVPTPPDVPAPNGVPATPGVPAPNGQRDRLIELFEYDRRLHIYALVDLQKYWHQSQWWHQGKAAVGFVTLPEGDQLVYAVSSRARQQTLELFEQVHSRFGPGLITGVTGVAAMLRAQNRSVSWSRGYHRYYLPSRAQDRLFHTVPTAGTVPPVEPLGPGDVDELTEFYQRVPGAAFFLPSMAADHTFCGIRDNGTLVAAAGTHVFDAELQMGAIGAVFTDLRFRRQGLGRAVTHGVVRRLAGRAHTIGLNVTDQNTAAIRVYAALGFVRALGYEECELTDPAAVS